VATEGDFAAATTWTEGTDWAIGAGVATHSAGTGSDLSQPIVGGTVEGGEIFVLQFEMDSISAGSIIPKVAGVAGTTRTTAAIFTEAFYVPNRVKNPTLVFTASAAGNKVIDDVSLFRYATHPDSKCYDHLIADGTEKILTAGWHKWNIPRLGIWLPSGGTVANLNMRGLHVPGR
jgi:hypothetical protein